MQNMEINAGVAGLPDDALLVDVRNESEYAGGHIPGSQNLPLSQILQKAEQTFPDKHRPIYVYCQSGTRSARSAKLLELLGYENVTDLGGISGYTGPRA
mgnify:FL=1